ncbi:ABC transporter I family member 10 [Sesamum angolense]|uniref:ABC transporter I family member 10 n=1 Tax=Sesamum angolense TaxID=2727404 RepID=A0AAE1XDE3_9LAMI|nr:ABC transporter I family member 10 [Sesamum angolense]
MEFVQILGGLLNPTGGYLHVKKPRSFVFQNPDHQKQRVAIAGDLADACKVLLLDELTSFLDENDQVGVIRAVKSCLASSIGTTALWVTCRLEELEYADGAVYMEDGRVVLQADDNST